ncbi:MAG: STAS domain-containing protein [Planctomycetota bacterium]|jgi:anti-sigma B factor antagonist
MELVRRQIGSVLVLSFAEPLCLEGGVSGRFKEKVRNDIADGHRNIVVDLGNVEFIDSSGLGALISTLKVLRANDGDLKLANLPQRVRSVLEITRLLRVFEAYPTAEDALRAHDEAGAVSGP